MKRLNVLLITIWAISLVACSGEKQEVEDHSTNHEHDEIPAQPMQSSTSKSPQTEAMANIGATHIHIAYHAPSVRGRTIFGGLVAYNEVWVTGAHSAASIQFYGDVELNGKNVAKGKYALFTIPGEEEWTIIINENYEQHLADDYDSALDVVRLQVTPKNLEAFQEQLLFQVTPIEDNHGDISISWADVKVSFNIEAL